MSRVLSTRDIIPIDPLGEIMWDALTEEEAADLRERFAAKHRIKEAARAHNRHIWRVVIALTAAAIILTLLAAGAMPARAHEFWIGNYRNADGTNCCGKNDCTIFAGDQVKAGKTGWLIIPLQEIVPYSETQGSEDGEFWRCRRWDGTRRCFFAPQPSS